MYQDLLQRHVILEGLTLHWISEAVLECRNSKSYESNAANKEDVKVDKNVRVMWNTCESMFIKLLIQCKC